MVCSDWRHRDWQSVAGRTGIALCAESLDRPLENIGGTQKPVGVRTVAGRRSGEQQVARPKPDPTREILEQSRDVEDHVGSAFVLFDFAVEPEGDAHVLRLSNPARPPPP